MTFTVAEKSVVAGVVPFRTKAGILSPYGVGPFRVCVAISSSTGTSTVPTTLGAQPATRTIASRTVRNAAVVEQIRDFVVVILCALLQVLSTSATDVSKIYTARSGDRILYQKYNAVTMF
jgi:hypothetical protein